MSMSPVRSTGRESLGIGSSGWLVVPASEDDTTQGANPGSTPTRALRPGSTSAGGSATRSKGDPRVDDGVDALPRVRGVDAEVGAGETGERPIELPQVVE